MRYLTIEEADARLKRKPSRKDMTGQRFGKLVVLKAVGKDKHRGIIWLCQCDCGQTSRPCASNLRSGKVKSCGCSRGRPRRQVAP